MVPAFVGIHVLLWSSCGTEDVTIPPIRKRDHGLRVLLACQWESFNRACKNFKIYYVSQLVLCDGATVDPVKLLATQQQGLRCDSQGKTHLC
jgi:hypothetical protein